MILRFLVFHGWLRWFVRLVGIAHGWWWLLPSSLLEDRDPLVFHVFLTQAAHKARGRSGLREWMVGTVPAYM